MPSSRPSPPVEAHVQLNRSFVAAALAASTLTAACGDVKVKSGNAEIKGVAFVKRDTTRALGEGDIRIASQDSAVEVAIIGDSIVAGFGQRVRAKLDRDLDTTKVSHDGLGGSIEKMVKGTVAQALNHDMQFPLSEVSDVRYEDGFLQFYDQKGRKMNTFERDKHDSDSGRTRFSESDANAFISAFKARKNFKA
jgi:hypothetical protein